MKNVANTFRNEAEISGLTPYKEVEGDIEQLPAAAVGGAAGEDPDAGFASEVGAPGGIVAQELLAEATEDGGVEGLDVVGRGLEAHLRVGEVEYEVLPLVPHVVGLEAKEAAEPVHEIHVGKPRRERRRAKVFDLA